MTASVDTAAIPDFESFLDCYKGITFKVAGVYCKDTDERKDLVQEIIIQLWRSF